MKLHSRFVCSRSTPPQKKRPLQKECNSSSSIFQGTCWFSGVYMLICSKLQQWVCTHTINDARHKNLLYMSINDARHKNLLYMFSDSVFSSFSFRLHFRTMIFAIEYSQPKQADGSGSTLSPNPLFLIRHVTIAAYPSSHNHGSGKWVPPASNISFLSFRVMFHFHEQYGSDSKHQNSSVQKIFIDDAAWMIYKPRIGNRWFWQTFGCQKSWPGWYRNIGSCAIQKWLPCSNGWWVLLWAKGIV